MFARPERRQAIGKFSGRYIQPLKLAQNELADDVHAGIAVVEAGNGGKLLAAIVLEDLGILLRDLLQRLQAIGEKPGVTTAMRFTPSFASFSMVLSV
jgi:hypothetical protein